MTIPVQKCRAVPRRHCQTVSVTRPRVVTTSVCVTQADAFAGGAGGAGGLGGFGRAAGGFGGSAGQGSGSGGYGSGAGVGGYADHRKDDFAGETNELQKRQAIEKASISAMQNEKPIELEDLEGFRLQLE